ncbi:MAG TPA: Holliday junction branch migration protein RuvA [Actinomycetota bacterium]
MIAFVEGVLAERGADRVVVNAGGLGYELLVSTTTLAALPAVGKPSRLLTHLQVRDDSMVLFGFSSGAERDLFELLITVSGVGPKMAMAVLSTLEPDTLRRAVLDGDIDAVTVVPGVGKKVAGRIVLDLRDKLGGEIDLPGAGPLAEVRQALEGMGLSPQEIQGAVGELDVDGRPVEELLREALRRVGGREAAGAKR